MKIVLIFISINSIYSVGNFQTSADSSDNFWSGLSNPLQSIISKPFSRVVNELGSWRPVFAQMIERAVGRWPERVRTEEEYGRRQNDHVVLDFIGLVQRRGNYTAEEYTVQSEDGYTLILHRISGSPISPKADGKPVVYMQHFLFGTTETYVEYGQNQSLALQLVDNGYDVWLGNIRGNPYSRTHIKYSAEKNPTEFWKFSMDEPALLDVPMFIDFALEKTKQEKLTFFGFSLGCTFSYMLLAGKPEYNDKVNLVINVAPAVLFSRPLTDTAKLLISFLPNLAEAVGAFEIPPQSIWLRELSDSYCSSGPPNLCTAILGLLADPNNIGPNVLPESVGYFPSGTSYYTAKHYAQLTFANRKLEKFNWSLEGLNCTSTVCSDRPEEYDLSLVTAPNVLIYGGKDVLVKTSDVDVLMKQLKNVIYSKKVTEFNHVDFMINKDVKSKVFDPIVEIMSEYL